MINVITVNFPPGAIQVHQDIPALEAIVARLTTIEGTLTTLAAKVETLVPDASQLKELRDQLAKNNNELQRVVRSINPAT